SSSLTDEQSLELARMVLRVEELFGIPQDVEWALDKEGAIVLLQCRPLFQSETAGNHEGTPRERERSGRVILNGGVSASPGAEAGHVFLVQKHIDLLRFPDGAVLVAAQALPQWAPLLNRAAAVVTEQGGITGHLATVAREFGVPALFGLNNALTLLKNGDMVTVDADTRTVYEGRIDSLLDKSKILPGSMQHSTIHQSLRGASRYIIPLHLLDPDAVEFSPAHCKTLHDITRFCHEKAVFEMFRFGKDHPFPERSSTQLYCDGPMQFWIINLNDGFTEEVTERWILLENICSIPMLSLWQGMTAVPWEGPPPVDSKGFVSVLFQSTTNPALDPSTGRSYGIRNYFMISKNFCTLQSRFGFHFSTVEALVGERPLENYISFQFKGGAADLRRRVFRAQFLSELLDHYGFRTEIRGDALFARMERYEQPFLEERLRVLGYLIIHTRQLDMIMTNSTSITHQRRKITADLQRITGSQ
ncbi:MAG: PEP-utilizing enzyme, partial [Deltaproteobacteria bacterium]